jgi:hypothetical protein
MEYEQYHGRDIQSGVSDPRHPRTDGKLDNDRLIFTLSISNFTPFPMFDAI